MLPQPRLEEIRGELGRVLASRVFAHAPRSSRFLQFVVEEAICGRADQLKEYTIGTAVFDRPVSFDPRTDSVVRVEARRLRSRLDAYYTGEGASGTLRIVIPKGTYVPDFTGAHPVARPNRMPFLVAGAAILTLAAFYAAQSARTASADRNSIAVLPFTDLTSAPANPFFGDGLVDEITQTLGRVDGLRVAARTSAYKFKDRPGDVRDIGRQLNVSTLLEGSIREWNGRLRVTAQLVSASDGYHIWAQSYDCDPADTFAVQERISRDITRALALRLRSHSGEPLVERSSRIPEARAHYLRGRHFWNRRTTEAIRTAIAEFEKSIAADASFALAHAALADAHAVLAFNDQAPPRESIARATAAARRALELDSTLAEAKATLAWIRFFYDWDRPEGERLFREALAANPNYSTAHQWYGLSLIAMRRFDEALVHLRKAEVLDPLSPIVSTGIGVAHYYRRAYPQALEQAATVLAMESDFFLAHLLRGAALVALARKDEASQALTRAVDLSHRDTSAVMRLAHAHAVFGNRNQALALAAELEDTANRRAGSAYQVASIYAGLNDIPKTLQWLHRAVRNREANFALIDVDPLFDPLRTNPAFAELLQRVQTPHP